MKAIIKFKGGTGSGDWGHGGRHGLVGGSSGNKFASVHGDMAVSMTSNVDTYSYEEGGEGGYGSLTIKYPAKMVAPSNKEIITWIRKNAYVISRNAINSDNLGNVGLSSSKVEDTYAIYQYTLQDKNKV